MPTYILSDVTAKRLKIARTTVPVYIRRGWIRGVMLARRWRIDEASVERLERTGTPPSVRNDVL